MALLFADGFDHYATAGLLSKWTNKHGSGTIDINASYGRLSTSGLRVRETSEGISKALGVQATTLVSGLAFKIPSSVNQTLWLCNFIDAGTTQVACYLSSDLSTIGWNRSGTGLQTISVSLTTAVWYYLEAKVTFDNTTGRIITKLNNVEIGDTGAGGIDTCYTANEYATTFCIGTNGSGLYTCDRYFDDVYVCDTTGSYCNDFLNDVWIQTVFPTGAGTTTDWSPSAGNNWDCVEETPPSTTDYVETSVLDEIDTYATGNVTSTAGTVNAVVVNMYAAKTTAGARGISGAIDSGGTPDTGTESTLSTDYANYQSITYEDPDTAAQWDITGVNAAEFGVKLTT